MIYFYFLSGLKKFMQRRRIAGMSFLVGIIYTATVIALPSFADGNELSVFRVEIDTTPLHKRNGSQVIRDLYISGGEDDGLSLSEVLDVYRRIDVQDRNGGGNFGISILVGQVKVIALSKDVALARTIALTSSNDTPVLRYHDVMIGDYAVPGKGKATGKGAVKSSGVDEKTQIQRSAVLLPSTLLFGRNDWKLKEESRGMLLAAHDMFNKSGAKHVVVAGYTCNLGMERYNLELSKKRAQSVADYLMESSGMPKAGISIEYYGEKFPLASNDREEGRIKNRRVEISFLPRNPTDLVAQK